jgi:hypothetical protein
VNGIGPQPYCWMSFDISSDPVDAGLFWVSAFIKQSFLKVALCTFAFAEV